MNFTGYLVFYSISLSGLYLLWFFTGSRRRDPGFDRLFMLIAPILSGFMPFMRLSLFHSENAAVYLREIPEIQFLLSAVETDYRVSAGSDSWIHMASQPVVFVLFFVGMLLILDMIRSIWKKIKLIRKYGIIKTSEMKIVPVNQKILPFSFMTYIFLNLSEYDPSGLKAILRHEKAHINQFHYIDVILYEIMKPLLWFHPIYWVMRRRMKESHEYLADRAVLQTGIERLDYMMLILKHTNFIVSSGMGNNFSKFITIKRLEMMKSSYKANLIYRGLVSFTGLVMIAVLFGFTNPPEKKAGKSPGDNVITAKVSTPFLAPVDMDKVKFTSGFGMRIHPIKKTEVMHNGIDLAMEEGSPVYATREGLVVETGNKPDGPGQYIILRHDESFDTFYSQLSEILVETGDKTEAGKIIGKVGSSGLSTGPHLHFEIRKNGTAVNPADYLPPTH